VYTCTHTTVLWLSILSGTTWVSRYQKKHSPTHTYCGHQCIVNQKFESKYNIALQMSVNVLAEHYMVDVMNLSAAVMLLQHAPCFEVTCNRSMATRWSHYQYEKIYLTSTVKSVGCKDACQMDCLSRIYLGIIVQSFITNSDLTIFLDICRIFSCGKLDIVRSKFNSENILFISFFYFSIIYLDIVYYSAFDSLSVKSVCSNSSPL